MLQQRVRRIPPQWWTPSLLRTFICHLSRLPSIGSNRLHYPRWIPRYHALKISWPYYGISRAKWKDWNLAWLGQSVIVLIYYVYIYYAWYYIPHVPTCCSQGSSKLLSLSMSRIGRLRHGNAWAGSYRGACTRSISHPRRPNTTPYPKRFQRVGSSRRMVLAVMVGRIAVRRLRFSRWNYSFEPIDLVILFECVDLKCQKPS